MKKYWVAYGEGDKYGVAKSATIYAKNKEQAMMEFMSDENRGRERVHGIAQDVRGKLKLLR